LRETIRNWHEQKIYVRQLDRIAGEVGASVVIFDADHENRYQYLTTWLGEHQNESDMAFYSTYPFEHLVGPGIGRAEYGGFLMTLPPRRMLDVWAIRITILLRTSPSGCYWLRWTTQCSVTWCMLRLNHRALFFRSIAAHLNRRIVYIPIGQLSPTKLKKIRVVHVLDSYERRNDAREYLW